MKQTRRHKRFRLDTVEINGKMVFATEVKILDISIGGVSLKADKRLNIGNEYVLKLQDRGRLISVKGVVVWSSLSGTREAAGGEVAPIYTAGMKFTAISAEKTNELRAFIAHHCCDVRKIRTFCHETGQTYSFSREILFLGISESPL